MIIKGKKVHIIVTERRGKYYKAILNEIKKLFFSNLSLILRNILKMSLAQSAS